jgi:hypothetical protein
MKKDSIIKMLKVLKAEVTDLTVAIIETILSEGGVLSGIKRVSLVEKLMKDAKLAPTKGAVRVALKKLNTKEVVTWTIIKGTAWVKITDAARIEYLKGEVEQGVVNLVSEAETTMNELSVVMKREGRNLKKKVLKNSAKKLNNLAEYLRKKAGK